MTLDIHKVVVKGSIFNQELRNIFYGQWSDPTGLNMYQMMLNQYISAVYAPLWAITSTLVTLYDYDVYKRVSNTWVFDSNSTFQHVGADPSDMLPNQVAGVIIGKVAAWRGFGRKFFGGFTEPHQSAGLWGASLLSALVTSAIAYVTPITQGALSWTPGIFSPTGMFHPFASYVVDALAGTCRRRKPGVGK
jgi:hypothetical protein